MRLTFDAPAKGDGAAVLFTENETNCAKLFDGDNASPYVKDAFHRYVIDGDKGAVNPANCGTKAAVVYRMNVAAGASAIGAIAFGEAGGERDVASGSERRRGL